MRRLPPLGAVRAFEAAARHLHFTRAADELAVTQAAISHQIRLLEDWLGQPLFARRGRMLTLTPAGAAYLAELTPALDRIATASTAARRPAGGPVRLTALPSLATRWLVPHLAAFQADHPGVDLQLTTTTDLWDGRDPRFDLGLRSGPGGWPGLNSALLAIETLTPLCSPALRDTLPTPCTPPDLLRHRLLHDTPKGAWGRWFAAAGSPDLPIPAGLNLSDSALALQAAAEGQGIVLGRVFLAAADLQAGRLVMPCPDLRIPNDYAYWLVWPPRPDTTPAITAVRDWILRLAGGGHGAEEHPEIRRMLDSPPLPP